MDQFSDWIAYIDDEMITDVLQVDDDFRNFK